MTAVSDKMPSGANGDVKMPYKRKIVWSNTLGFLALHLAYLYGWYVVFQNATLISWLWGLFVGFAAGIFGVGMGAHRYYTHRAFKANLAVQLLMTTFHTIAGQNCLYVWVRDHRQHHKYTDTDADPHNSTRGFFFSHIGWLMVRKHPEVLAKGKTIDMSDLEADPIVMFQKKYYKTLYVTLSLILPTLIPLVFWNEHFGVAFWGHFIVRSVTVHNITWLVNSAAHLYGNRPYNNKIQPVESAFVSFFTFGEGWHNYHHTFPWDYRAAEFGQKYDSTTRWIDYFASKGWIHDRKQASQSMVVRWAKNYGDGTHPVYGVEFAETKKDEGPQDNKELQADKNIEMETNVKHVNGTFHDNNAYIKNLVNVR